MHSFIPATVASATASFLAGMAAGATAKYVAYGGKPPAFYEDSWMNPVNRYLIGPAAGNAAGYLVNAAMFDPASAGVAASLTPVTTATYTSLSLTGSTLGEMTFDLVASMLLD